MISKQYFFTIIGTCQILGKYVCKNNIRLWDNYLKRGGPQNFGQIHEQNIIYVYQMTFNVIRRAEIFI